MPRQSATASSKLDAKPHKINKLQLANNETCAESDDDRLQKISDAAYYIALERGFDGGDPVDDWLVAESLVDGNALSLVGHRQSAN